MKHPRYLLSGLALSMLIASGGAHAAGLSSEHKPFGKTNDGTAVEQYVLRNSHGMQATVITYGGVLQSLKVPDKHGKLDDVVLGFDDVQGYQGGTAFFGAPSAASATAWPAAPSNSMANAIRYRLTTAPTHCMAAPRASTSRCGKPNRSRTKTRWASPSPTCPKMGKWAFRAT